MKLTPYQKNLIGFVSEVLFNALFTLAVALGTLIVANEIYSGHADRAQLYIWLYGVLVARLFCYLLDYVVMGPTTYED